MFSSEIQKIRYKQDDMQDMRKAIQEVATSQARMGFFADALVAARSIDDPLDRAATLLNVAERQAKAGYLADALATARGIDNANFKAQAVCAVAAARAKMNSKRERNIGKGANAGR